MLNGKSFEYFSLRPGMRKECMMSSILFNVALGGLANTLKGKATKKCLKVTQNGKKETSLTDGILHV